MEAQEEGNCVWPNHLQYIWNNGIPTHNLNSGHASLMATPVAFFAAGENPERPSVTRTNSLCQISEMAGVQRRSVSLVPSRKAKRIKFFRNGDPIHRGSVIAILSSHYKAMENLLDDLTRILQKCCVVPGALQTIYTMCGEKINSLEELQDGQNYVCCCKKEHFKNIKYNLCPARSAIQPKSNSISKQRPQDNCVAYSRNVILIRNGARPRKIMKLFLYKNNSRTYDQVLTAITSRVTPDCGYVQKVYSLAGAPVLLLADFFKEEDVFFIYGAESDACLDDFCLTDEEIKAISAIRQKSSCAAIPSECPTPNMPKKAKNMPPQDDGSTIMQEEGFELPEVITNVYVIGPTLSNGDFATVLKIWNLYSGEERALKVTNKNKCKNQLYDVNNEVQILKQLKHENIITLFWDVDHTANKFLIMEYGGMDLFDAIKRFTYFTEDQSRIMIRCLASAMLYLHAMHIVHRDIKPENILVKMDTEGNVFQLKLADFGFAAKVSGPLFDMVGTPQYMAPEVIRQQGYGCKIDVWSAGNILYILLCGFPPFSVASNDNNEPEALFEAIKSGIFDFPAPYWSETSYGARSLIANMLQMHPDLRFSSKDVMNHFWTAMKS